MKIMRFEIQKKINEVYQSQQYNSALGHAYYICEPILKYLNEHQNEEVELDFEGTNLRNPFVINSLCYIVNYWDEDKKKRTHILNCKQCDFGTEVDSLVDYYKLYKDAQSIIIRDALAQNMFELK